MKDFREAAEKYEHSLVGEDSGLEYCKKDFIAGAEHGYSEAKKEQEEFKENVRQMLIHFNKSSLTLGTVTLEENIVKFCSYKHDVLRYLKDNEQ